MIGTPHALFLGVALICLTSLHWKSTVVLSLRCIWLTFYSPPGRERGRKLRWVAGAQKQSYMILQRDLRRMQLGLHDKELHCCDVCQSTSSDASHTTALQLHWQTATPATPGSLLPLGLLVWRFSLNHHDHFPPAPACLWHVLMRSIMKEMHPTHSSVQHMVLNIFPLMPPQRLSSEYFAIHQPGVLFQDLFFLEAFESE